MANIFIVGGGVAGLSAGIYALLNGHHATICEKHSVAGGNLTGWQRGDYHIDNCIHWLTGTNPNTNAYKMWQELGVLGDIEVIQIDSLYTCEHQNQRVSMHKDLNKIKENMIDISPIDKPEIVRFIKAIEVLQYMCDIGGEKHDKKCGISFYLSHLPMLMKYHRMSTGQLAKRFNSPVLQQFISCFFGNDFASLALLFVFANFTGENGGIPRGSSYAMAQRMVNRFISLGGKLITDTEVIKINREGQTATSALLSNGEKISFDYAILTGDPKVTFNKMLDIDLPKQLTKSYNNKKLIRFSGYHCAFSCDTDKLNFSGDFIFEIPAEYQNKLHSTHLILREFSHEKSFSPEGKSIIQSLTFCSEEDCRNFIELRKNSLSYKALKEEIAKIIETLIIQKFPELNGKLKCIDVWTPATYQRYVNSEIGSFMGFAMPPKYVPSRASNKIKGLKNVFLATQWQQVPGGLPIAALCGKNASDRICVLEKHKSKQKNKIPATVGM